MEKDKYFKKILFFSFLIFVVLAGIFFVFAYGNPAEGFMINASTFSEVNASGMCIEVNASTYSGASYFVPSATYVELNSFYTNIPSGISAGLCSSYPSRIVYYPGKVNQYTDPVTGEWKTDEDCSSGNGVNNLTYCQDRFPEAISYDVTYYTYEHIYDWKNISCIDSENLTGPSVRCRLCNVDYTYPSVCEFAGCNWHPYGSLCGREQCSDYSTSSLCEDAGCFWDGSNCDVSSEGCLGFYDESDCNYESGQCGWEEDSQCCYDLYDGTCNNYYNQGECDIFDCQWDTYNGRCHLTCPI